VTGPRRLVLYDGFCGFCDRMVRWLLDRDRGRLAYAPLQGPTAAELRARHPEIPEALETLIYVETGENGFETVSMRSEAVFRLAAQLAPPWNALAWLRWLPRPLTDLAYRSFARHRYRLFGRLDDCRLPSPEERSRFLD
jgi:predicted DCC family thiol-disulfide oxidoreductase YuxK